MSPDRTVVAVGTLDTKGAVYAFLRERLLEHDGGVIPVDAGVLGERTRRRGLRTRTDHRSGRILRGVEHGGSPDRDRDD